MPGIWDLMGAAARGFTKSRRMVRLCAEAGWIVDDWQENYIRVHFKTKWGVKVLGIYGGEEEVVRFWVVSDFTQPRHRLLADALASMLQRNYLCQLGAWIAVDTENGNLTFAVRYQAFVKGLDVRSLKTIADALIDEVLAFENLLREAGWI